jgi:hypothetical protein
MMFLFYVTTLEKRYKILDLHYTTSGMEISRYKYCITFNRVEENVRRSLQIFMFHMLRHLGMVQVPGFLYKTK